MKQEISNQNNKSVDFINALIQIGKEFNNQLKEYTNNNLFGDIFPDMKKDFDNFDKVVNELDKSIKNVNEKKCYNNKLNHAHIEETETEKSYEYRYDDNGMNNHDEIIEFLKEKLNDFTFKACTNNDKAYKLVFNFGKLSYTFKWNKDAMHFLGETNDLDFVFVNEEFYFDETKNDFFTYEGIVKECDVKELPEDEGCNEQGPSEIESVDEQGPCDVKCEDDSCDKASEETNFTADKLYCKINQEVMNSIETDLLPNIKTGTDRLFNYQQYTIDRTGNIPGFDVIVFTLEDVQLNCEKFIPKFWEIIPYTKLVRFFIETYGFPKVFILDKNVNGEIVHEVRCHLK